MAKSHLQLVSNDVQQQAIHYELPEPLRRVKSHAETYLQDALTTVFAQVDDTFFDLSDKAKTNAEQAGYIDAMRLLRLEKKSTEMKFSQAIGAAFNALGAETAPVADVSFENASAASLELEVVDNEDLEEIIAIDTLVAKCVKANKSALDHLAKRIDFIVPAKVDASNNPLGPEVICKSLGNVFFELELDIRSKLVLFKLIERHFIAGLDKLLAQSNDLLAEMGVLPDLDKGQRKSARQAQGTRSVGGQPQQVAVGLGAPQQDASQAQAQGSAGAVHPSDLDANNYRIHELVNLVAGLQPIWNQAAIGSESLLGMISRQVQASNAQLGRRSFTAINLIDQLFGQISNGATFSEDIDRQLHKLQLPMLRVALQDDAFFTQKNHPGRLLINEVTEAAIRFPEGTALAEDPVGKAIIGMADKLSKTENLDNTVLKQWLVAFSKLVKKERQKASAREQRMLDEVKAAERVNQARQEVDAILLDRMQDKNYPKVVVDFAENAWCQVMFLSKLRAESYPEYWKSCGKILDQVLTHVESNLPPSEKSEQLLGTVRKYLTDISYDPYELGCVMGGLEQLFADQPRVNGLSVDEVAPPAQPVESPQAGNATQSPAFSEGISHRSHAEADTVTVTSIHTSLPGEPQDTIDPDSIGEESKRVVASLSRGSWVDFTEKAEDSRRCKVAGVIDPPGKYIFVNHQGFKVSEMSFNQVAEDVQNKKICVVESNKIFDNALERVISGLRNSKEKE